MADINLQFGVAGGDSLLAGSGRRIHQQLSAIVKQIQDNTLKHLVFSADQTSLNNLVADINKSLSKLSVPKEFKTDIQSISASLKDIKVTLDTSQAVQQLNDLKTQASDIFRNLSVGININSAQNANGSARTQTNAAGAADALSRQRLEQPFRHISQSRSVVTSYDKDGDVKDIVTTLENVRKLSNGVIQTVRQVSNEERTLSNTVTDTDKKLIQSIDNIDKRYNALKSDREKLGQYITGSRTDIFGSSFSGFEEEMKQVQLIRTAIDRQIYNTDALKKLGVTDYSSAISVSDDLIQSAKARMSSMQAIAKKIESTYSNIAVQQSKLAGFQKQFDTLGQGKYASGDNSLYQQTKNTIVETKKLLDAIEAQGKNPDFVWSRMRLGIGSFSDAVYKAYQNISTLDTSLRQLKNGTSALSVNEVTAQANKFLDAYNTFTTSADPTEAQRKYTRLFNNQELKTLASDVQKYTNSLARAESRQNGMTKAAETAYTKLRQLYNVLGQNTAELSAANSKLVPKVSNSLTDTGGEQAKKNLDSIDRRLQSIEAKRDAILKPINSGAFGGEFNSGLERMNSELSESIDKIAAIKNALKTGIFTDENGNYNITSHLGGDKYITNAKEAAAELSYEYKNADKIITRMGQDINKTVKSAESFADNQNKLITYQQTFNGIVSSKYDASAYSGLNDSLRTTQSLMSAIERHRNGETGVWENTSAKNYADALRQVELRLKEINDLETRMVNFHPSVISDTEVTSQINAFREAYLKFRGNEFAPVNYTELYNDEGLRQLAEDVAIYTSAVRTAAATETELSEAGQQAFSRLKTGYNTLTSNVDTLSNANTRLETESDKAVESTRRAQNRILEYQREFHEMSAGKYFTGDGSAYASFNSSLKETQTLLGAINRYRTGDKGVFSGDEFKAEGVNNYVEALRKVETLLAEIEAMRTRMRSDPSEISNVEVTSQAKAFQTAYYSFMNQPLAGASFGSLYNSEQLRELSGLVDTYITELNKAEGSHERMSAAGVEAFTKLRSQYYGLASAATEVGNANAKLIADENRKNNILTQTNKIYAEATAYYNKYSSGIRTNLRLDSQWQTFMTKVNTGGFGNDIGAARSELAALQTAAKDAGAETLTLWAKLKKLFTDHYGSVSAVYAISLIRRALTGMVSNVREADKAMTELIKVTDLSATSYERFQRVTAANLAAEAGSSIADTINATADFARLGYDLSDSTALAKAALIYKNVGDGIDDIATATESIISTIKGFGNIDAKDAMSIIDMFNEVGKDIANAATLNMRRIAISVKGRGRARPRKDIIFSIIFNMEKEELCESY